mmetsp:Transcript_60192/g.179239  ORF Transcript_60192/g.179239 Transcript_60192/m.179239 type:complete len:292 (-) Transcript_60192:800-1675(-)
MPKRGTVRRCAGQSAGLAGALGFVGSMMSPPLACEDREELLDSPVAWCTGATMGEGPPCIGSRLDAANLAMAFALDLPDPWRGVVPCELCGVPPSRELGGSIPEGVVFNFGRGPFRGDGRPAERGEAWAPGLIVRQTPTPVGSRGAPAPSLPSSSFRAETPSWPGSGRRRKKRTRISRSATTAAARHATSTRGEPPPSAPELLAATSVTAIVPVEAASMPRTLAMLSASFPGKLGVWPKAEDALSATGPSSPGTVALTRTEPAWSANRTLLGLTPEPTSPAMRIFSVLSKS